MVLGFWWFDAIGLGVGCLIGCLFVSCLNLWGWCLVSGIDLCFMVGVGCFGVGFCWLLWVELFVVGFCWFVGVLGCFAFGFARYELVGLVLCGCFGLGL